MVWRRRLARSAAVGKVWFSLYVLYHNNIKKSICFNKKNEGRTKLSLAEWRQAVWRLDGGDRAKLAGPVVSGFQQHLPDGRPRGTSEANLLSELQLTPGCDSDSGGSFARQRGWRGRRRN